MHSRKRPVVKSSLKRPFADEVRFLRNWVERPLSVGAVAPSSPALARLMASYIDTANGGAVVELGPGTGVVTDAIIARGVRPEDVYSIEYGAEFFQHLRKRLPEVNFIHGDAFQLKHLVSGKARQPLAAVVSSLPLFTRPLPERIRLIEDSLSMLAPGAPFIQFSYALVPPVPQGAGEFQLERSNWVIFNLPPARVWVYRRR
jgi:phosphatidylethanolamine/phosphatidyl-N-methylethanolamine N-methyltransferase